MLKLGFITFAVSIILSTQVVAQQSYEDSSPVTTKTSSTSTYSTAVPSNTTFGFSPLSFPAREMQAGFVVDYYAAVAIANFSVDGPTQLNEQGVVQQVTDKLKGLLTFYKQELNLTIVPHVVIGTVQMADRLRVSATRNAAMIDEVAAQMSTITYPTIANKDLHFGIYLTPSFELLGTASGIDRKPIPGCVPGTQTLDWIWAKHFYKVPTWAARRAGACNGSRALLPADSVYNNGFTSDSRFAAIASLFPSNFSPFETEDKEYPYPREKKNNCDPLGAKSSLSILKTIGALIGMREIVPHSSDSPGLPSWAPTTDRGADMVFAIPGNLLTSQIKASQLPQDILFGETGYSTLMGQINKQRGTLSPINRNDYRAFQNPTNLWKGCGKLLATSAPATTIALNNFNNKVPARTRFFIDLPLTDDQSSYLITYVSPSSTANTSTFRQITPDLSRHRLVANKNSFYGLQSFKIALPDVIQPITQYTSEYSGMRLMYNSYSCSPIEGPRIFGSIIGQNTICGASLENQFLIEQIVSDGRVNRQTLPISIVNQKATYGFIYNTSVGIKVPYGQALSIEQDYVIPITPLTDAVFASELAGGDVYFIPEGIMLASELPLIDSFGYGEKSGTHISEDTLRQELVSRMETYKTANSSVTNQPESFYWPKDILTLIQHVRNPLLYGNEGKYEGMLPSRLSVRDSLSYSFIEKLIETSADTYKVGSFKGNVSSIKIRIPSALFNGVSPDYKKVILANYQNFELYDAFRGKGFFLIIPRPVAGKPPFRFYSRSQPYFAVQMEAGTPTPPPTPTAQVTSTPQATPTALPTVSASPTPGAVQWPSVLSADRFASAGLRCLEPYTVKNCVPRQCADSDVSNAKVTATAQQITNLFPSNAYPNCSSTTFRTTIDQLCVAALGVGWGSACDSPLLGDAERRSPVLGVCADFIYTSDTWKAWSVFQVGCVRNTVSLTY